MLIGAADLRLDLNRQSQFLPRIGLAIVFPIFFIGSFKLGLTQGRAAQFYGILRQNWQLEPFQRGKMASYVTQI